MGPIERRRELRHLSELLIREMTPITATFFETPAQFRAWLRKHHRTSSELWVGYRKKHTGLASITWQESVDEALCFGWIDGIRKSIDADSYTNRFTPRRRGSAWSTVNTRRAAELLKADRMRAAGRKAFEARDPARTVASWSDRRVVSFDPSLETRFKANRAAWKAFQARPPGYRKRAIAWVMSARHEETRARRLAHVIATND